MEINKQRTSAENREEILEKGHRLMAVRYMLAAEKAGYSVHLALFLGTVWEQLNLLALKWQDIGCYMIEDSLFRQKFLDKRHSRQEREALDQAAFILQWRTFLFDMVYEVENGTN